MDSTIRNFRVFWARKQSLPMSACGSWRRGWASRRRSRVGLFGVIMVNIAIFFG